MNIQSLEFLAFLVMALPLCLAAGRKSAVAGRSLLLLASALFCLFGANGPKSLLALLLGCGVTSLCIKRMVSGKGNRRAALLLGCGYHLAVLAGFKYTGFVTGGAVVPEWVPIGLSFFAFQQLWYLKEVYTGEFVPREGDNPVLYALFFPILTSGPILRPRNFFPQLREEKALCPDWQDAAAGIYAICIGFAKKTLLADPLGTMVGNGWSAVERLSAPAAWLVMLGYTLQLYLDFSGYCDIAVGIARLLGIRLPANFNAPYRARSVTEFWKRWHITLTSFLRECLYIPLGGSRKGTARTYCNILLVFLVSGLWHGAGWTFLAWGALHGLAQVVERAFGGRCRLPKGVAWILTFLFLNAAWVFFRAPGLTDAMAMLRAAVSGSGGWMPELLTTGVLEGEITAITTVLPGLAGAVPGLVLAGLLAAGLIVALWPKTTAETMETFTPGFGTAVLCTVLAVWAVLSFSGVATFIYSNF